MFYILYSQWDLDEDSELALDCSDKSIIQFISESKDIAFPDIRKLRIENMDQLDHQGTIDMNLFMKSAAPKYLQVLYLHGGEFPLMDTYKEGLGFLLQSVHLQIYIFKFSLKESGVRTIFENWINAQDVVLRGCQIAEIRDAFKLDDTQSYHLETLNFYWTYRMYYQFICFSKVCY